MVLERGGTMIGSSGQIHKRVEMDTHNVPKLVLSVVELLLQIFCLQDKRIMSANPQGKARTDLFVQVIDVICELLLLTFELPFHRRSRDHQEPVF